MKLWIDCEWNDYRGELISMALVDERDNFWYEVLECLTPSSWVSKNVMGILLKEPVSEKHFKKSLETFLATYDKIHIISDWPEDIAHFCNALIIGAGFRLRTPPLTMEVVRDLDDLSKVPHNALEDARAIKLAYIRKISNEGQ
jgi:hypothetical protein